MSTNNEIISVFEMVRSIAKEVMTSRTIKIMLINR